LKEEQNNTKNREIELNSEIQELNSLLEQERQKTQQVIDEKNRSDQSHTAEYNRKIKALKASLDQEKQKTQDAFNEKWEEKNRADQLLENLDSLKSTLDREREEKEEIQAERDHYKNLIDHEREEKKQAQKERDRYKEEADQARLRLEEKDKVMQEIQVLQEHTKKMVRHAEANWRAKDVELKQYKAEQEEINTSVQELLSRFCATEYTEINLKTDIRLFKQCLESFVKRYLDLQFDYETTTEELAQLAESHKNLSEVQFEWKTIASHMAEKLEEFRKNVLYELVIKLQLPMDGSELNVLSRNLSPSDDDAAIWNEVLQLSSAVNTQRFVLNVLENAKNLYDNFVVVKSQLKRMKGKYTYIYIYFEEFR
ncbi:hypothetical protein BD770DRAFT_326323, partial [Pilaira anomala]